jgi:hypothetical protein
MMRSANEILARKQEWKRQLGDIGVDERIILKWILQKYGVKWVEMV